MKNASRIIEKRSIQIWTGIFMATLWGWFSYRHMLAFYNNQDPSYLLFCVSETLTAVFFILRTTPKKISVDPLDYLFAIFGTFTPLFFTPAAWGIFSPAKFFIFIGVSFQIFSLISLNRSFALVAANREIKTKGMYHFIRHPLYASYLTIFIGYILTNTTIMNITLAFITTLFLFLRIFREEKHLIQDREYKEYMSRVRFRVIPYIF